MRPHVTPRVHRLPLPGAAGSAARARVQIMGVVFDNRTFGRVATPGVTEFDSQDIHRLERGADSSCKQRYRKPPVSSSGYSLRRSTRDFRCKHSATWTLNAACIRLALGYRGAVKVLWCMSSTARKRFSRLGTVRVQASTRLV